MKLRWLNLILGLFVLTGAFVLFTRYVKSKDLAVSDEMKSQLTVETSTKNPATKGLKSIIAGNLQKQEMVERKDFGDASLLAQERVYTEKEINDMTEEEFQNVVKDVELKLPKISDIRKIPAGALHRTPAPIMQAGRDLGLLKEVLKIHESYGRVAAGMYQRCAKDNETPTAVRALCLTNLIEYKRKSGGKINRAEYPAELLDLTKMITDM